jgi:hypothetical protein
MNNTNSITSVMRRYGIAIIFTLFAITSAIVFVMLNSQTVVAEEITVYKSPTCGCCNKWVDHLKDSGFEVKSYNRNDMPQVKQQLGVAPPLQSCHTAIINGYVIEGHVPATDIQRLLSEKPAIHGLTVPGMPMGSPGMEGPRKDRYDVLAIDKQGKTTVFSQH